MQLILVVRIYSIFTVISSVRKVTGYDIKSGILLLLGNEITKGDNSKEMKYFLRKIRRIFS